MIFDSFFFRKLCAKLKLSAQEFIYQKNKLSSVLMIF